MKLLLLFLALFISFGAVAQTQTICAGQNIPSGWVKTSQTACSCCGTARAQMTIQRIDLMAPGATVNICSEQYIPAGWVKIGQYRCSCCAYNTYYTIKKSDGLPNGTILSICGEQPVPSGWVIIGKYNCSCCGYNSTYSIQRIDSMAPGTTMDICSEQYIPGGWIKTGEYSCSCCGYNTRTTMKKYTGLAIGTTLSVCSDQAVPGGWIKISENGCSCCGNARRQMTIKKLSGARVPADALTEETNQITLYPNPAKGFLNVPLKGIDGPLSYVIADKSGRTIISQKLSETNQQDVLTIDTSTMASGLYIIRITARKGVIAGKFVVE